MFNCSRYNKSRLEVYVKVLGRGQVRNLAPSFPSTLTFALLPLCE